MLLLFLIESKLLIKNISRSLGIMMIDKFSITGSIRVLVNTLLFKYLHFSFTINIDYVFSRMTDEIMNFYFNSNNFQLAIEFSASDS